MAALSFRRLVVGTTCLVVAAGSLATIPQSAGAAAPPKLTPVAAAPASAGLGATDLRGMLSPFTAALGQGRWLTTSAMTTMASLLPGQELLVAPELPVRFVPGTTETTPVTVKNTTEQTLPATLKLSYWWAEVGATTPINGHNAAEVPLGVDLAPGAEVTLALDVRTPIQSDNGAKRLDYDLYVDLKDGTGWWSATHSYGASSDATFAAVRSGCRPRTAVPGPARRGADVEPARPREVPLLLR